MKKRRIKNRGRFFTSLLLAVIIIGLIIFEAFSIAGKIKAKKSAEDPFAKEDEEIVITDPAVDEPVVISETEQEVIDAKAKILATQYPVATVEDFDLILVNKTHALSKDYWPEDLVTVERTVDGVGNKNTKKLRAVAAEAFEKMCAAAEADGYIIKMRTGFRSYDYQTTLYNSYVTKHGQAEADTYSARPGYSEHQSGLACDITAESIKFVMPTYDFANTPEGQWVYEHAHEYGFIIRYTDGSASEVGSITGYVAEPWHIRYVGTEHATAIWEKGITFEEYLGVMD